MAAVGEAVGGYMLVEATTTNRAATPKNHRHSRSPHSKEAAHSRSSQSNEAAAGNPSKSRSRSRRRRSKKLSPAVEACPIEAEKIASSLHCSPYVPTLVNNIEVPEPIGRPPLYGQLKVVGGVDALVDGKSFLSHSSSSLLTESTESPVKRKERRRHRRSSTKTKSAQSSRQGTAAPPPPRFADSFLASLSRPCPKIEEIVSTSTAVPTSARHHRLPFHCDSVPSSKIASKSLLEGGALVVTVRGLSPLPPDPSIVHPFVRVWLLNCMTGNNLLGENRVNHAAITPPCDLRLRATRSPSWESRLQLPVTALSDEEELKNAVVLFEVCDAGTETMFGTYEPRQGLQRICWGFFMLWDRCRQVLQVPKASVHIQLYPYPWTSWSTRLLQTFLPTRFASSAVYAPSACGGFFENGEPRSLLPALATAPAIFHIFQDPTNRSIPFKGGLLADVDHVSAAHLHSTEWLRSSQLLAYEEYLLSLLMASGVATIAPPNATRSVTTGQTRIADRRGACGDASALKQTHNFRREEGERAMLPTDVVGTVLVDGIVTCMTVANSGSTLALGVTVNMCSVVRVFDCLTMESVGVLSDHTAHIHCVAFHHTDALLLSGSADMTVRVWKPSSHSLEPSEDGVFRGFAHARCVLVLPHPFPVYCALFHHRHIVSCGCSSHILSWECDAVLDVDANVSSSASLMGSELTASFDPAVAHHRQAGVMHSQVVSKVSNEENAVILAIDSAYKGNHVWSLSSSGMVTCWRAIHERVEQRRKVWQMSSRRSLQCPGATELSVEGKYVLVSGPQASSAHIIEYATGQLLHQIPMNSSIQRCRLLPDGAALVGAGSDGSISAWECGDGCCCTPSGGYHLHMPFSINRVGWSRDQNITVFVSSSPLPEDVAFRLLQKTTPPIDRTALVVAGCTRGRRTIVDASSPSAAEAFTVACGGTVTSKRRAVIAISKAKENSRAQRIGKDRDTRLYDDGSLHASEQISAQQQERTYRVDRIVNFWKGLTESHRHRDAGEDGGEINGNDREAVSRYEE